MAARASVVGDVNHQSPKFRTSSQTDELSSTPHASFVRPEPMDLSAISSIASDQSVLVQERARPSFCEHSQSVQKKGETYTQAELDVLYNSYVQWTYLDQCLQKRIKDDERTFMAQTNVLWKENENLRENVADLDRQIAEARYLKNLDEILDASNAQIVVKGLDEARRCHTELAESLDTTRHQLPMEGIYLPCDSETYSEQLTETLEQALRAAEKLDESLGLDPKTLEDCTVAAKTLLNNFEEIGESLNFTGDLTREMKRLTVQESSLTVQKMMDKNQQV